MIRSNRHDSDPGRQLRIIYIMLSSRGALNWPQIKAMALSLNDEIDEPTRDIDLAHDILPRQVFRYGI